MQGVDRAARVLEVVLGLALIAAVLMNFVNVVGRYGFGTSFLAGDEVQTYIMVYIAFLGAAVVTWRGLHLRMDVFAQRFPPGVRKTLGIAESVLVLVLSALVTWVAWRYVGQMYALGAKSQTAQVPMWIPHGAILLGFSLILGASILRLVGRKGAP